MAVREELKARLKKRGRWIPETGCIEYQGATNTGYGSVMVDHRSQLAHRLAWEAWVGPIPEGLNVLHKCDNRPCFAPDHLYLGTQSDNTRDRHERKPWTTARGEQMRRKLTTVKVLEIRERYATGNINTRALGKEYGVTGRTVSDITLRRTWKHI